MILYHRTSIREARAIIDRGFQDQKWGFDVDDPVGGQRLKLVGVWLSDQVIDEADGPPGDAVVEVTVDPVPPALAAFEIPGVLPQARLWVVPARVINPVARVRIHNVDPRTSWWFEAQDPET